MSHVLLFFVLMSLLSMLRCYRAQKAFIQHLPKHCIFKDATIMEIVKKKPFNIEDLLKINGIGTVKAKQYGEDIIGMVKGLQLSMNKPVVVKHDTRSRSTSASSRRSMKSVKSTRGPPKPTVARPTNTAVNGTVVRPTNTAVNVTVARPTNTTATPMVIVRQPSPPRMARGPDHFDVYILELEGGKVYVGKSSNMDRRFIQHSIGIGSVFTKTYHPTGKILPRLGNISGDGDAAERDETLRYMYKLGIDNVRGWRYTQLVLSKEDRKDAERNMREVLDLCRKCGQKGHFIKCCTAKVDRHGNKI
jgi:predicted GIY-YIG superfamily endonuclease